jgi:hypothetical protein
MQCCPALLLRTGKHLSLLPSGRLITQEYTLFNTNWDLVKERGRALVCPSGLLAVRSSPECYDHVRERVDLRGRLLSRVEDYLISTTMFGREREI